LLFDDLARVGAPVDQRADDPAELSIGVQLAHQLHPLRR
jgi:hypothetical protein